MTHASLPPAPIRRAASALAAVALLAAAGSAGAAEEQLSLRDALARAAAGNLDLQRERVHIAVAAATLLAARGQFDTVLGAGLTFSRTTTPPISETDVAGGVTNRFDFDLRGSRNLETGGSLGLTFRGNSTSTNSRFSCGRFEPVAMPSDCTFYASTLSLEFRHPLLRGFGTEVTQAILRKQRVQQDLVLLNRQTRAANVIRDVATAYWELAYATQELAIHRSAVELAREQLRFTEAQIEVGRAAPLEAAAAQRAIAEREQQVVIAEQGIFFRTLDLRRQFGLAPEPSVSAFVPSDVPSAAPHEVEVGAEIERALQNNPQLKSLRMGLKLNEIDVQTAEATLRPQLDFVGSFGSTGRKSEIYETLAQTAGLDDVTWSAGLTFSVPIENRTARGNTDAARHNARLAQIGAADLELLLRDNVARTAMTIRTASRRVELARAAVGFAEKDLEAEKARFTVGRSTNNEILRRQQELKAAQIQVVRATVDLINGETALDAVTGEILDRHGITLKGT